MYMLSTITNSLGGWGTLQADRAGWDNSFETMDWHGMRGPTKLLVVFTAKWQTIAEALQERIPASPGGFLRQFPLFISWLMALLSQRRSQVTVYRYLFLESFLYLQKWSNIMLQTSRPGFHIRLFASCIIRIQLRSNSVSLTRFSWRCFYKDTCNRDLQGHCSDTNWPTCLRDLISSVNIILRKKMKIIFF